MKAGAAFSILALLLLPRASFALDLLDANTPSSDYQIPLFSTEELPARPPEVPEPEPTSPARPGGFGQWISERIEIGYGSDFVFNDNILLQDNQRKEDTIGTLEGLLVFYDPRGALLYGSQWEVNAFRYFNHDANAIDHTVVSFIDWDPGGRYQLHFTHYLDVDNLLVFGAPGVDLLRRSTDFQRFVSHAYEPRAKFWINEDDAIIAKGTFARYDDQAQDDAGSDFDVLNSTLDWNHRLTRTWSVYAGVLYKDTYVPGDKLKSTLAWGGRLGGRYELNANETFEGLLELDRPKRRQQERSNDLNYSLAWSHLLNPRTQFTAGFTDAQRTSFVTGRTSFRSRAPSFRLKYELTPVIALTFDGLFEKQKSSSSHGGSTSGEVHKLWQTGFGARWQVSENMHVTCGYSHKRSTTRDFTNRLASVGFEGTF